MTTWSPKKFHDFVTIKNNTMLLSTDRHPKTLVLATKSSSKKSKGFRMIEALNQSGGRKIGGVFGQKIAVSQA